jgi:hypothetical protein
MITRHECKLAGIKLPVRSLSSRRHSSLRSRGRPTHAVAFPTTYS